MGVKWQYVKIIYKYETSGWSIFLIWYSKSASNYQIIVLFYLWIDYEEKNDQDIWNIYWNLKDTLNFRREDKKSYQ